MTTLTINIDDSTPAGKRFLSFLKTLSFVSIVKKTKESRLDKALDDVKKGKVYTAESAKDLIEKALS